MASIRPIPTVVLVFACLSSASCAQSEDVRHAVEAGNRAFVAAFLRGDATAVANLYTEDAQVMAPGSPVASGRPAIAAFWQNSIDSGIKDVTLATADIASASDLAYETGTIRLIANDGTVTEARYVVIWRRVDGQWMLHRDIWNSSKTGSDGTGVQVHKHFFDAREEVLDDLKKTGFWPTTYVSEPGPPGDIHWHNLEVHGYVLEGHTWFLDADRDIRHDVASGDKIVIPARTLHAEGEITENLVYIIALPEPGPFDPFLEQLSPEDLKE